jgi:hypothetical protein
MLNIKRLLNTELGRFFISVIIGIGLATLFRKSCTDKNCIIFDGPVINEVDGKTFRFGEFCYKYDLKPNKCDPTKQTVLITDSTNDKEDGGSIPSILKPQAPVKMDSNSWF